MSKIVIIGIDGLDPFLLNKWRDDLPNVRSMFNDALDITVKSTIPPDSICAWASIFTGDNPAEHGLIENINYLSDKKISEDTARSENFRGKTFWDLAGNDGKSVCIINPFIAYPAWNVNGVMVSGPVFEGGDISAYPEQILKKYTFPPIGGVVDFPDENELGSFLERTVNITEALANVSLEMYKDLKPDLFFLTFLTLDRLKHFLWRFTDKDDMYFPGENPYEDAIKDFYITFDEIIGKFSSVFEENTVLMVISDHGHRRRCTKCLNLNEVLRRKGYLKTAGNGASGLFKKALEKCKVFTISSLTNMGLQDWIYKIAKLIPGRKALKKSTYLIDNVSSPVMLSNLCGTNPYGGLDINAETEEEYEKHREDILSELMGLNKVLGTNVVKWAGRREEVYSGRNQDRLPDILFELYEEYGVGMDLYSSIVTENYSHKKISGGHKREAVLIINGENDIIKNLKRPESIMGIKDLVMGLLSK